MVFLEYYKLHFIPKFLMQMSERPVKPWYGYGTKYFLEYCGFDRDEKYYGYVMINIKP